MNSDDHEIILEDWQERPQYKNKEFVSDGPIDWERWNKTEWRVLFLAKEVNAGEGKNWSLPETIRCEWGGPRFKIWWTAAYWAYGIQNLSQDLLPPNPKYKELWDEVEEAFLSTAIVNIKKREGGPSSDDDDLSKYVDEDGDKNLLRKQVSCLNPNFVVCCNTWHLVKDVWPNAEKVSEQVYKIDDMLVLDFWHPSNRYPDVMNYYTALALLHQVLRINTPDKIIASDPTMVEHSGNSED